MEKIGIIEGIKLYITTVYNRISSYLYKVWLKVCKKFSIFKLKPMKTSQQVLDYLNAKGFKYTYEYKYQKENQAHAFYFVVGKNKIGNAFWSIEELNKHQLDYFHRTMIHFYLTHVVNKKYKDSIKAKVKGVPRSTVFFVERIQTKDGMYNVSCHKDGIGGFKVIQYEKVA